jgi:hypothetical protein
MFEQYEIPPLILDYLENGELIELACVSHRMKEETQKKRILRKKEIILGIMRYFHTPNTLIFSMHRNYQPDFKKQIRRLFQFLPEWFEYLNEEHINYLDLGDPYYYYTYFCSPPTGFMMTHELISSDFAVIESIVNHIYDFLQHNESLCYCNLGIFQSFLKYDRLKEAVTNHPHLYHLEIASRGTYDINEQVPTSLYRIHNNEFEWRHYPPSNLL